MRVLIIKTSPLAEIIAALPVLDYLHRAVPEVEIDWVVEESLGDALDGNPLLSALHQIKSAQWKRRAQLPRTLREIGAFRDALAQRSYDFVFDFDGTLASGIISRFSGGDDRIGFQRENLRDASNLLFSMRRVPLRRQDAHLSNRCLRLASVPFAKDYQKMDLEAAIATGPEDDLAAKALLSTLSDGLVFLFDCGADSETKLWNEKGWIALGKELLDSFSDASILLPWSDEEEREQASAIAKSVAGARVLDRYTLKGMAALLKRVDLVVGGDTDTVQLAALLGTPTVSFYRATDGKLRGPQGEQHVIVQSPIHCSRCGRHRCDKDLQCRGTVKMESLLAGINSLFAP